MVYWTKKQLREQVSVVKGQLEPTMVLQHATYLHGPLKRWMRGNIWIYGDRIVYVGEKMPDHMNQTEVVDVTNYFIVPGYVEPHAHPFQLYNPQSLAHYASQGGTTTLVNDNMPFFLLLPNEKALSFIENFRQLPTSVYWWSRFDAQTELRNDEQYFQTTRIKEWMNHPDVIQGGELTAWPKVLHSNDMMLHWMQEMKSLRKPIDGHLPGASEKTLTMMELLGVTSDHEAMTGKEAYMRATLGLMTTLRYSSIRPDAQIVLKELQAYDLTSYESFMYTTDGSMPLFLKEGMIDAMIAMALQENIKPIEAYNMASLYPARHFRLDDMLGIIAPGRLAHLNILSSIQNPIPDSVIAKGVWVKRNGEDTFPSINIDWKGMENGVELDFDVTMDDLHFSMPFGIKMINSVITKPYQYAIDVSTDALSKDHDENFLVLLDRHGKWRVNTILKGFATDVGGLCSTYSTTGDILLIGKSKKDMVKAFQRVKEMKGGICLIREGEVCAEIELPLGGGMSFESVPHLITKHESFVQAIRELGYPFEDPIYTLLFLSSTHLPYIRITPVGMYDVMKQTILFPSLMR